MKAGLNCGLFFLCGGGVIDLFQHLVKCRVLVPEVLRPGKEIFRYHAEELRFIDSGIGPYPAVIIFDLLYGGIQDLHPGPDKLAGYQEARHSVRAAVRHIYQVDELVYAGVRSRFGTKAFPERRPAQQHGVMQVTCAYHAQDIP